uniref:Neuropeptide-Like Protein n=1 Tax=Steinernema glaseri TaxID=37863 RepID=A0A1I8ALC7_9BILA
MQSTLCALALCSLVAVLLAGEMPELESESAAAPADKRGLRTFAFAKRYPMSGFAKRAGDESELTGETDGDVVDGPEEQKRSGFNRFAFAKRSMRNFAFAKRAVRPFAFAKKSMRNFAFAKRAPFSSFA